MDIHAVRATVLLTLMGATVACHRAASPGTAVFRIATPYKIETFDPHADNALPRQAIAFHFYDALVTTNAAMRIEPALAVSWETPGPDTWIFHLRPRVHFQDGHILGAGDVAFTINRLLNDNSLEIAGYLLYVTGVRALNPLTVEITTSHPVPTLLSRLRFVAIVPDGSTAASLATHPDGTGPYRLLGYKKDKMIQLARNDDYWDRQKERLPRVDFLLEENPKTAASEILSGQVQMAECDSKNAFDMLAGSHLRISRQSNVFLFFLGYDLAGSGRPEAKHPNNPFLDQRVREAVNLAIDRKLLTRDMNSLGAPASQLVPPSVFGFNPGIAPPPYDPRRAKELLREAGYPDGFEITMACGKTWEDAASLAAAQLAKIGIRLKIETYDGPELDALLTRHKTSFYMTGLGCLTGDMSDILDNCIHTIDPLRHFGLHNYSRFSDPAIDSQIERTAELQQGPLRRDLLEKISAELMRRLVWIPLYVQQNAYAIDPMYSWQQRDDNMILAADITSSERY